MSIMGAPRLRIPWISGHVDTDREALRPFFFFPHSGNGAAIQSGSPGWKVGQGQGQARGMSKSWSYAP